MARPLLERFWERVNRCGPDECWPWTGGRNNRGDGWIRENGKQSGPMLMAHRLAYELLVGPLPEGLTLIRTAACVRRDCVNPGHLEPLTTAARRRLTVRRFWSRVAKGEAGGCWLWLGRKDKDGYGVAAHRKAHRVAYELLVGPIPEGLTLDHYRLNPGPRNAPCSKACVNPEHLEPATSAENSLHSANITAEHARQTTCIHGHPFDTKNTYFWRGRGRRERSCRECNRAAVARHKTRRSA